jgi:hypothetical protein
VAWVKQQWERNGVCVMRLWILKQKTSEGRTGYFLPPAKVRGTEKFLCLSGIRLDEKGVGLGWWGETIHAVALELETLLAHA